MARPKKNPDTAKLTCKACGKSFDVTWSKRNKQKYCSKSCSANDPEIKEKNRCGVKKSFDKKYGCHAMQTQMVKDNFKTSMIKKYGVEAALKDKTILKKAKRTMFENYGTECALSKTSPIRKKIIDGWMQKYGVDHPAKAKQVIEKLTQMQHERRYDQLMEMFDKVDLVLLTPKEKYIGYHYSNKYDFRCKKCGALFTSSVYTPSNVYCEVCHPDRKNNGENLLLDFLKNEFPNESIERRNRSILGGQELDFYVPNLKIAIEYNGLYWHSETIRQSKNYHLNKTEMCEKAGIKLIHIYESEWLEKQNIIKSMLRQFFGKPLMKIHGRECEVRLMKKIDGKIVGNFLKECHIQGADKSSVKYGLFYKGHLVSVMTFVKSRFDKKYEWEISRYCTSLNTKIHGGAGKLFSTFVQDFQPQTVVSYSDRRFFTGNVYASIGFDYLGNTDQGYHYISPDYKSILNRQQFQKHKLKNALPLFDSTLSEWENMKANGFDRTWDCGHSKWSWKKP